MTSAPRTWTGSGNCDAPRGGVAGLESVEEDGADGDQAGVDIGAGFSGGDLDDGGFAGERVGVAVEGVVGARVGDGESPVRGRLEANGEVGRRR
ncbi:MAG: hypothetical protein AAFX50_25270 [Acidobacteriota bacterium]